MKLKEIPDRGVKEFIRGITHFGRTDYVPVFICGLQNSGTTLLLELLDQSFATAGRSNETAFYISKRSSLKILASWKYASFADFRGALNIPEDYPDKAILRDLLSRYRKVTRVPCLSNRIIDNSPGANLARIHRYQDIFDNYRIVIIYRDPISTIEGLMRKWELFRKTPPEDLARYWSESYEHALLCSNPSTVVLDHRDLLINTDNSIRRIASHCELDKRKKPLRIGNRPDEGFGTKGLTGIKNGKIQIDQSRLAASPEYLTKEDIENISKIVGPIYDKLQVAAIR